MQTLSPNEHLHVRANVVNEVQDNRDRYADFDTQLEGWIDRMRVKGTWGDGIAARACSNAYMAPVVIWRFQNPSQAPTIFLPESAACDQSPPILLELDESTPGAEHYSPLRSPSETDIDSITETETEEVVTNEMLDKALELDPPKVVIDAAKGSDDVGLEAPNDKDADDTLV